MNMDEIRTVTKKANLEEIENIITKAFKTNPAKVAAKALHAKGFRKKDMKHLKKATLIPIIQIMAVENALREIEKGTDNVI